MRYIVRSLVWFGLFALAAGSGGELLAQTQKPGEPPVQLPQDRMRGPFDLLADRDGGVGDLRLAGRYGGCLYNAGTIDEDGNIYDFCYWQQPSPAVNIPSFFSNYVYFAAPPSERNKHMAAVAELANTNNKGYTVNWGNSLVEGEVIPADGQLGPFHSGQTARSDGSCFDMTDAFWGSGTPMLAHSDCPPTWGSLGWQGTKRVDEAGWLAYANQVGDLNFSFDDWKVPDNFKVQPEDKFLGAKQVFGFISDYSSETLFGSGTFPSYGNIIPASMGGDPDEAPTRSGWPLGMLAKIDAYSFPAKNLLNTGFYKMTIVNNSEEVYGVGLDYDSLYLGIGVEWFTFNQGTSVYRDPANNVVRAATMCQGQTDQSSKGAFPGCGPGGDPQHFADSWGSAPPAGVGAGFNYGAAGFVLLKSPIGDMRNKQFTDPTSPFFGKGDPESWDDTITFSHGHMCGFHGCNATIGNATPRFGANDDYEQKAFGLVASITDDVIGNRNVGDIATHTMWDTWRWEEFNDPSQLDFNRWTPGNDAGIDWDWNEDGVQDELAWDDCSDNTLGLQFDPFAGVSKRCSVAWSDTLTSGWGNVYSNNAGIVGVGPVSLAAGETTQFVWAVVPVWDGVGGPNLVNVEAQINEAIAHYQRFYLLPESAPRPNIVSVDIQQGGSTAGPDPETQPGAGITLYWDDTTDQWEDAFIQRALTNLLAADPATALGRLRELNPLLADTLAFLVENNVEALYLFKSCDGSNTFTDDANCASDPATDPEGKFTQAGGWLPYASFEPDEDGNFPNSFTDQAVFGGRSFLYSLNTETRGLTLSVITGDAIAVDPVSGQTVCTLNCSSTNFEVPKILPILETSTSVNNVVNVYIPVANQAGSSGASVTLVTESPDFLPFARMNVTPTSGEVDDGNYSLVFGDTVRVTEVSELDPVSGDFILQGNTVEVVDEGVGTTTFTTSGPVATTPTTVQETIVGTTRTRLFTYNPPLPVSVLVDDADIPLVVSNSVLGEQTVPGTYFSLPNFPSFTYEVDNSVAGDFAGQTYLDANGDPIRLLVEPSVTWLDTEASGKNIEGRYRINWLSPAFGDASPYLLDFADPTATKDAIISSLEGRSSVVSSTNPDFASFLGLPAEALLEVNLPFEIENVTAGEDNPTPVSVVITNTNKQTSLLLGDPTELDTMIVQVAETEWLPGDGLVLIEGTGTDIEVKVGTAIIGCDPGLWRRIGCNPVSLNSRGGTGYIPNGGGQTLNFRYFQSVTAETEYGFNVASGISSRAALAPDNLDAIRASLDSVKVVPNPFVMFSEYSTSGGTDRVIFTHMPPRGAVRIYTVTGQFVQQVKWGLDDLNGNGDLFFNLRTREGNEMAAGLYLFVVKAFGTDGSEIGEAKGKFVLIK
ncbi:MAG: hypothetical protein GWN99_11995 [Gemmatimonadetes bacterium]|uniref:Uncharacterized protein n=1 Tax=Candidatus Kutchimonas denitrificans TaxID=3056748 RepID=A0AAE5CC83_9BACT|nr:hypothetical protein [Gemmatimonadota bacterium]NIR75453.1 hypothetical protein [Candidatus Kutchimonas denitrificans]NIS01767.1 hypothetical protein [Gemmatimonadota bacterium]NIT67548.1 hypothetical protein [Gemmatimonadota bacterium]NIU53422.1 hypothetical protein [Gemmatimonadota bacterium]